MTVKQLITQLLDYDLNNEVVVGVDYPPKKQAETGCIGAEFEIRNVSNLGGTIEIKVHDWRGDDT